MKDDEELEMLLGEIPQAISQNILNPHSNGQNIDGGNGNWSFVSQNMNGMMYDDDSLSPYKYTCPSPVSGFSLQCDVSSSSLISVSSEYSLSNCGSPIPPPLEDIKCSPMLFRNSGCPNGSMFDWKVPDSLDGKKANENLIDELSLSSNLRRMYISEEPEDVSLDPKGFLSSDHYSNGANRMNVERNRASDNYTKAFADYTVVKSSVPRSRNSFTCEMSSALFELQQEFRLGSPLGSGYIPGQASGLSFQSKCGNTLMNSPHHRTKEPAGYYWQREIPASNLASPVTSPSVVDGLLWARHNGMNFIEERGTSNLPSMPHLTYTRPHPSVENIPLCYPSMIDGRMTALNNRLPHGDLEDYMEDSVIISGEVLNYAMKKGLGRSKGHNYSGSLQEIVVCKPQDRRSRLHCRLQFEGTNDNGLSVRMHCPFSLPFKFNTLAEAQGYIYFMAKDQLGCRFLQRMFDEGTPLDVQIIFNEIIDQVVELVMNPFGNYLMQKLLEVCNEEQRLQILLMVTKQPSELVRISLNTHGTRVVQKLIETLKTKQQISLVISALEPGFLALIKDLNGNHVIQRCLQCLNKEDNKFIFVAAAKYCVDIATHQHGCSVLQRCISHSTEEYRENLIAEISSNGLLLAQDAFGNYVVQYIVEQKIPRATSKLVCQFEGNYVHLSTQKFSSHVVEKCLFVLSEEVRSKIIHELLSASNFEQLLQDPHANYVVQTALRISEGPLHNSLVEAIESHKATTRNSPYSKRIFSHKLLKK